jgi:hypothetical protein
MPAGLWSSGVALVTACGLVAGIVLDPPASRSTATGTPNFTGALGWLLFVGTAVHVAATGVLFLGPQVRQLARSDRLSLWRCPAGLVALVALVAVVILPSQMGWMLLAVFAWQLWHYQRQNLGMVALAASSRRLPSLTRDERRALMGAGAAGIVAAVAHPQLLGLNIHPLGRPIWVAAGVLFAASSCYGLFLLARRPRRYRPCAFSALYALSLSFWAPMFVFRSPFAAVGGMTIAHGFQYLLVVGLVLAGQRSTSTRLVRVGLGLSVALLAGGMLSLASHLHGAPAPLRALFGAYVGVLTVHFVMDRRLWRLRDPAVRAFLASRVPYLIPGPVASAAAASSDGIRLL